MRLERTTVEYNTMLHIMSILLEHKSTCFCVIPVLDTSVPTVFQRESKVIPIVTTCPPLKGLETKAFVW